MGPIERLRWLRQILTTDAPAGAVRVAVVLADRADTDGCCWPSVGTLAADTKLSTRSVQAGLQALTTAGMIEVDEQAVGDRPDRRTNRYRILLDGVQNSSPRNGERGADFCANGVQISSPKHTQLTREETPSVESSIPDDLTLYRDDEKLVARWPELVPGWMQAFRQINVLDEIRKAHAWELANVSRRKRDRSRFLNGWLNRAAAKAPSATTTAWAPRETKIARMMAR